jgi:hypothetical protein
MRRFPLGKSVAVAYPAFFSYCDNPSLIITQGGLSSTQIWDLGELVFAESRRSGFHRQAQS